MKCVALVSLAFIAVLLGAWAPHGSASLPAPPNPSPSAIVLANQTFTNSNCLIASDPGLMAMQGQCEVYLNVTFSQSGYYMFALDAAANVVTTTSPPNPLTDITVDYLNMDCGGYDSYSLSYYFKAINVVITGTPGNWNMGIYTCKAYVTAGTHRIGVFSFGDGGLPNYAFFRNLAIIGTTGPVLLAEPAGTRDPSVQIGSSYSLWNLSLGSGATWSGDIICNRNGSGIAIPGSVPGCDPITTDLTRAAAALVTPDFAQTIYVPVITDPVQTWAPSATPSNGQSVQPTVNIRIPSGASPAPPAINIGGDAHMMVYSIDRKIFYEGGSVVATGSVGVQTYTPDYYETNNTCARLQNTYGWAIGEVLTAELNAAALDPTGDHIPHALRMSMPKGLLQPGVGGSLYQGIAWPAASTFDSDAATSYTGHVLAGSTVGIPSGVAMPGGMSGAGQALFHVLQDRGAINRDSAGNGGMVLYAEVACASNPTCETNATNANTDLDASIRPLLRLMTNQGPSSVNGGGTYSKALAPGIDSSICPFVFAPYQ